MSALALRPLGSAILLPVAARPNAGRSAIQGVHDGALKVALAAPPEKGKANAALLRFLAKALGLRRAQLSLHAGPASRSKVVRVEGLAAEALEAKLEALLAS